MVSTRVSCEIARASGLQDNCEWERCLGIGAEAESRTLYGTVAMTRPEKQRSVLGSLSTAIGSPRFKRAVTVLSTLLHRSQGRDDGLRLLL